MEPTNLVVYTLSNHDADVKLKIFDELEFHVHSTVLKTHSAFFRRFLDSPDKVSKNQNLGKFKYVWVSVIDEDGSWSLIDVRNQPNETNDAEVKPKKLKGSKKRHEKVFSQFIGVFYGKVWTIKDDANLEAITELADYYCALPMLSKSLPGALSTSIQYAGSLLLNSTMGMRNQNKRLELAVKLRSPELFRDCMIYLVGYWWYYSKTEESFESNNENPQINALATKLHAQICVKICATNRKLQYIPILSKRREDRQTKAKIDNLS
ncbi:hypothetical protein DSL72_006243 [Monilinia vaccinii-corymbosi]|uniref:BTB domain-containing protein n=1 Tax=Monilinia vaccinii-corymbosi TaxID=61207 RepID=A0A8A3PLR4_9HELO|nr:hypothetical protein DSL72_006243 [Monilinia vaccinii-corymbosi]